MARYAVSLKTDRTPEDAFAYVADLANFAEWDPGVLKATQAVGNGPGLGAAYDVTVAGIGRPLVLRYEITTYEAPLKAVARAESPLLSSVDEISVEGTPEGSIVTYDALLTLKGLLGAFDPLLKLAFGRIGDRAATGLIGALGGERIRERA
ncbi:MAG: SRPBCC family protein [Acidobacteriota bacterium]